MNKLFDEYSLKARLYPALLTILPLLLASVLLLPALEMRINALFPIFIGCGALYLLTHLVRTRGRSIEGILFQKWGGMPSNIMLRVTDNSLDENTKARYRSKLSKFTNIDMPSKDDELRDIHLSDDAYGSAGVWLRENTKDTSKYNLLFKENIGYGFRRNMYGVKILGILISIFSIAISTIIGFIQYESAAILLSSVSSSLIGLICLLLWVSLVNEQWVRDAAYSYANQLLSSLDSL